MRAVTLCFLIKDDHICLAMKKRGFGEGKLNGVGGKVADNETIEEGALREMEEEIGVKAKLTDLNKVGNIKFHFNEKPDWNQQMHIYFVSEWEGEPTESEEMKPQWYKKDSIPYNEMWVDDPYWLPNVLAGKKIEGEFHFVGDGGEIDKFDIREI